MRINTGSWEHVPEFEAIREASTDVQIEYLMKCINVKSAKIKELEVKLQIKSMDGELQKMEHDKLMNSLFAAVQSVRKEGNKPPQYVIDHMAAQIEASPPKVKQAWYKLIFEKRKKK